MGCGHDALPISQDPDQIASKPPETSAAMPVVSHKRLKDKLFNEQWNAPGKRIQSLLRTCGHR